MELAFTGKVIEWRGPAPYYYVPVPDVESADTLAQDSQSQGRLRHVRA